jgi:divalent metal cation (Fe/Co/Zn/Cd) transporter
VAGFAVTAFIVHVGWQVTGDLAVRLMDSVDPTTSTPPARPPVCPGARPGRWMGRSPLLEFGVATDPDQPFAAVDHTCRQVERAVLDAVPRARYVRCTPRRTT